LFQRYQTRIGGPRNYQALIYKEWYYLTTTSLLMIEQWLWYLWFRYGWPVTQGLHMLVLFQMYQTRIGGARNLSLSNLQGIVLFHDYFVVRAWTVTLIPLISIWMACNSRVTHVGVVSEVSDKDWRSKEFIKRQSTRNGTISRLLRCSCLNSDSDTSDFDMTGL